MSKWVTEVETIQNVFCATGAGGGVDASCSPGGSSAPAGRAAYDAVGERAVTAKGLTANEVRAQDDYRQSGMFYKMQALSRGSGWRSMLGMHSSEAKQSVANLDSAISKGSNSEPLTVHRGMKFDGIVDLEKMPGFDGKASIIRDNGFVSTTLDPSVAERFADSPTRPITSVVIKSNLPTGTNCLKMPRVAGKFDEAEVLLGRGSQFRVTKVTVVDDGKKSGHRRYEVETEHVGAKPRSMKLPVSNAVTNKRTDWPNDRFLWSPGDFEVEADAGDSAGTENRWTAADSWPAQNVFCPTGAGGGIDSSCSPGVAAHGDTKGKHDEHGGHGAHALGHTAHEVHELHEGHELHHALSHGAGHAADAAGHGAGIPGHGIPSHGAHGFDAHHEMAEHVGHELSHGLMEAGAMVTSAYFGSALKGLTGAMQKTPGFKKAGEAIASVHDGMTKASDKIIGGMQSRYGHATTAAILGSGSFLAAAAANSAGMSVAGKLVPGKKLIGAIPLIAAAEVGKRLGMVGKDSKLEGALGKVGSWVHAARTAAGKPVSWATGKAAAGGLKAARAAGRVVGAVGRETSRVASEFAQHVVPSHNALSLNGPQQNLPEQVDPSVNIDDAALDLIDQLHEALKGILPEHAEALSGLDDWLGQAAQDGGSDEGDVSEGEEGEAGEMGDEPTEPEQNT